MKSYESRNITFIVRENHKQGWFCVERNQQEVSVIFRYYKTPNKKTIGMMQSLIDEAESGKYNNKKTLSDRIQDVVQQRKLTSYMNNTKWREMLDDFIEIPQLSIMYKTLFDEILEKHHIYFEYEKDSGVFIVYGYR